MSSCEQNLGVICVYACMYVSLRIARKLKTLQYRLGSPRTPHNLFDRMKNCIERVELSFGFAVMVFVFAGSVFTSSYLRLNKGTCRPGDLLCLVVYLYQCQMSLKVSAKNPAKSNKAPQKFQIIHVKLVVLI